jgi:hypothetical protein
LAHRVARVIDPPNDALTRLADRYRTDKGSLAGGHHYTRVYSELFEPLRNRPIRLLEVGLMGLDRRGWDDQTLRDEGAARGLDAPSLRLWSRYFPRGEIFGLDFNDFTAVKIERCRIFRGDASSEADLLGVLEQIGGKLDIIIDDASHASDHQQITLGALFPALAAGGIYIIEDLFFQPKDREPDGATKTVEVLRRAEVDGEFRGGHLSPKASAYLAQHVDRVALFDSLAAKRTIRNRDGIGILWKKA